MKTHSQSVALALVGLLMGIGLVVAYNPVMGATFVWDGGHPAQDKWSVKQNWGANTVPANDGTADLIFTGSIRLTPDADSAWSVNSLAFDAGASAFAIFGSALTIDGTSKTHAISNTSTFLQTIDNALIVTAAQAWSATSAGLAFGGTVDLGGNALTLTGASDIGMTGVISGTGSLVKTGAGTLTLSGANTYSGGTTVSAGILQGTSASLQGNITNQATVRFDQAAAGDFTGVISGAGTLVKDNTGTLTVMGANTFTGATTISGGTLALGVANALADSTAVAVATGASFQLAAASETVGSISGTGNILLGSYGLTVGGTNASTSFDGVISGVGGSLTKVGTGSLTLTGTNTYSGGTTVSAGSLIGHSLSLQGNIAVASGAAVVFNQSASGSYDEILSGAGGLTKQGTGSLTLTGANTFTGATQVDAGTLVLGAANALADTTAVSVGSGATFQLGFGAETVGSIAGAGSIDLGSFNLTAGGTGASTTFAGIISGSGGSLTKTGAGTLTLGGANTYTGGTTVDAGTLQGTSTSLQGNILVNSPGGLVFDQTASGNYAGVISGAGTVTKQGSGTLTLSGANIHTGATSVTGGTLALGGDDVLSASSALSLGTATMLNLGGYSAQVGSLAYHTAIVDYGPVGAANYFLFGGGGASTGTLTINNFSLTDGDVFAFQFGASGITGEFVSGVYFYGIGGGVLDATNQSVSGYGGTWDFIVPDTSPFKTWDGGGDANTWSTAANWSGDTAPVSSFTLKLAFDGNTRLTPVMNGSYDVNTLRFEAGAGAFSITASGGGSKLTFGGSVPGIIQLSSNAQSLNVPMVLNSTTIVETSGAGNLTLAGVISGSGGLNKLGGETLILSGANTYTGATTIAAGTVILSHSSALGSTSAGTSVSASATLGLQNGISVGAEALALDGTLRNLTGTNSYAGAISGSGSVFVDAGTLTLAGTTANTYTGLTTINTGTLQLDKSPGVTAVAGDILIGNGAGAATLKLLDDNQISDTAALTLASGGTPIFDLNTNVEIIGSLASTNTAAQVQLGNSGSLTTGGNNASTLFAGVISEAGSLTKEGTGTFTLSGANTYSGATTVNAGTLVLQNSSALGTTGGGTTVAGGATLQLENSITVGAEALSLGGTLRSASGTNTFGGAISGAGVVVVDAGTFRLSGTAANTFTGTTTVNTGTLELNKTAGVTAVSGNLLIGDGAGSATVQLLAANQIANTSAVTLAAGGTVSLNLNNHAETIGSLASSNAAAAVQLGSATLATGANNSSTTFAGVISGTGGLTKEGTGTFTLTGVNTYTGATTVSAGILALGGNDRLDSASNLSLGAGSTLSLGGTYSQEVGVLTFNSATIDLGPTGTPNYFLFNSVGSFTGTLTVANWSGGTDVFGVATNSVSQAFLNSVFFSNLNVGIGSVISDTPVVVGGYGSFYTLEPIPTFVWSGGQTTGPAAGQDDWDKNANWAGGVAPGVAAFKAIVMAGNVKTASDMTAAYQINSLLFRSDAGAFTISSSTGDTVTVGGGGIYNKSTETQTIGVPIAMAADQTWTADAGSLVVTGNVLNATNTLTVTGASNTTISGVIGGGSGGVVKDGAGTLTLSGTNTYTGGTTLNAGVVSVGSDANLGDTSGGLTFAGGTLRATAGLTSARAVTLNAGGGTLDSNGVNVTLSGAIVGAGGLTKDGLGTLFLTGTNNYSGGTTITAGTLQGTTSSLQGDILNHAALIFDQASAGSYGGDISGTGSMTKSNAGVLTLTGASTYTGATNITGGTLAMGADNVLAGTTALTISSGATLDVAGHTLAIGSLAGEGDVTIAGGLLQVGGNNTNTVFGGTLAGTGVFEKLGTGGLTFDTSFSFGGELKLTGGTLTLAGINLTLGTLRISGDTVLDFGNNSATVLSAGSVIIENNAMLTINNWIYLQDFFYATGAFFGFNTSTLDTTPSVQDVRGQAPQNQVDFSGFGPSWTMWDSIDNQITPAPEPATYGALMVTALLGLFVWRRWRGRRPNSA